MNKQEIDTYISINYERIKISTQKYIRAKQKKIDYEIDELLSLAYQHLIKYQDDLKPTNIESYVFKYIFSSILWSQSKINKMYRAKEYQIIDFQTNDDESLSKLEILADDESDLNDKILLENIYNHQLTVFAMFRATLNSVDQKIFDAIYVDKLSTINQLKDRFNVGTNFLVNKRIEIKKRFIEYANNNTIKN